MRGHDAVAATAHRESARVADRPISTTEWRQRIIGLHGELGDTAKSLEEKIAARRAAAGQLLLGVGSSPPSGVGGGRVCPLFPRRALRLSAAEGLKRQIARAEPLDVVPLLLELIEVALFVLDYLLEDLLGS